MRTFILLVACLAALLSGCAALDSGYQSPEPPVSPMWHRSDRSLG